MTVETDLVFLMIAVILAHTYLGCSSDPNTLTCKSQKDDGNLHGHSAFVSGLGSAVTTPTTVFLHADVPWSTDFPFFLSCLVLGSMCLYSTAVVFLSRFFRSEVLANQFLLFSSA